MINQVLTASNCRNCIPDLFTTCNRLANISVNWQKYTVSTPSSVMMGIFAPVVTDVCLTNPWTGLFSGEDLSIPGGVKPKWTQTWQKAYLLMHYSIFHQRLQTGTSAELIYWGYFIHFQPLVKHKVAECDVTVFLTRSNISLYIIDVTHCSFCFP